MNDKSITLVRGINYLSLAVAVTLWVVFFVQFFGSHAYTGDAFLLSVPYMVVSPLFILCGIIITAKNNSHPGILLYGLFLSMLAQNNALSDIYRINNMQIDLTVVVSTAIAFTVLIKSLQLFPRKLSKDDIKSVFPRNKIVAGYLAWTLNGYTWVVLPAIFVAMAAAASYRAGFIKVVLFAMIMLTALLPLFVNYRKATPSERNRILWLFWGLISHMLLVTVTVVTELVNGEIAPVANLIMTSLKALILAVSLVMSVFFYNTFDTNTLVRRTIVDGVIFTAIVIIYNTVEHYFLHWMSHTLHLSGAMISSFISGLFVLVFSPIHHKLMHFLERKIKKHGGAHTAG